MNEAEENRGEIKHAKTGGCNIPIAVHTKKKPGLLRNGGKGSVGPDKTPFGFGCGVAARAEPTAPEAPLTTTQSPGRGGHSLGGPLVGGRDLRSRTQGGGGLAWSRGIWLVPRLPPPPRLTGCGSAFRSEGSWETEGASSAPSVATMDSNNSEKNARGRPRVTPPPSINRTSVRFLEPLSFAESRGWCLSGPGRSLDPVRL